MNDIQETIALIPGWGFNQTVWQPLISQFTNKYNIINIELPEHKTQYRDIDKVLDNLISKIEVQVPKNSIVLGWSLGGLIGTYLAYKFQKKFKKLITLCSSPKFAATETWPGINGRNLNTFRHLAYRNLELLLKRFSIFTLLPQNNRKTLNKIRSFMKNPHTDKENLLTYLDILIDADIRPIYSKINIPTLHILSEEDNILPSKNLINIHTNNKNHEFYLLNECCHIPFLKCNPKLIKKIENFIKNE